MSYSISITPPGGSDLPDPQESISAFCACPGNLLTNPEVLGELWLNKVQGDSKECIRIIKKMVAEIDKGNEGKYNDAYAVSCDEKWSQGRETMQNYNYYWADIPMDRRPNYAREYASYVGYTSRQRWREEAIRYLGYYLAGYQISYEW